jgi:hypothetical protein
MQHSKITFTCLKQEIHLQSLEKYISFMKYSDSNPLIGDLFRIELTSETLISLTQDLFRPHSTFRNESLQKLNGMIVRDTGYSYQFVGFARQPSFLIPTRYGTNGLQSTPYTRPLITGNTLNNDDPKSPISSLPFDEIDYSVPHKSAVLNNDRITIDTQQLRASFLAYAQNTGSYFSRSRGAYYCVFIYGKELVCCDSQKLYFLDKHSELDLYTREALLFIWGVSGFNSDRFINNELISNHTQNSYVLASVRNKLNVFHNSETPIFDVHYIDSNDNHNFYLLEFMRKTHIRHFKDEETHENLDVNSPSKTIPCCRPLWFESFVGHSSFIRQWDTHNKRPHKFELTQEYSSLVVYDTNLKTNIIYCNERDFLIEMLTIESSDVISVRDRIVDFFNHKRLFTNQYVIEWPMKYKSPFDMARDLFRNEVLFYLLRDKKPMPSNISTLTKAFMLWLYRKDLSNTTISRVRASKLQLVVNNSLPVRIVKERVEKPLMTGEHTFNDNGKSARIHLLPHEGFLNSGTTLSSKCYSLLRKTINGLPFTFKLLCQITGKRLVVDCNEPDYLRVSISSQQKKIIRYVFSLLSQMAEKGSLDLKEAFKSEEMPDMSSPINRIRLPNRLLEKVILNLEFKADIPITLTELDEYRESFDKKSSEYSHATFTSHSLMIEALEGNQLKVKSDFFGFEISFPWTFDIEPVFEEIDTIKPIDDFSDQSVVIKEPRESMLVLLFRRNNLDYNVFKQMNVPLERSAYLYRLYMNIRNDFSLVDFLEENNFSQLNTNKTELISYDSDCSFVKWSRFAGFAFEKSHI